MKVTVETTIKSVTLKLDTEEAEALHKLIDKMPMQEIERYLSDSERDHVLKIWHSIESLRPSV